MVVVGEMSGGVGLAATFRLFAGLLLSTTREDRRFAAMPVAARRTGATRRFAARREGALAGAVSTAMTFCSLSEREERLEREERPEEAGEV